MDFSKYEGVELIKIYGDLLKEMKQKKLIRSKNVVGDIGEYIAIDFFNKTKGLPKLQSAPPSTKNIDAISIEGERYSIKCTTTNTTGTFFGLSKDCTFTSTKPLFEYVIIVKLDENFQTLMILQVSWDIFFKHKHWHSRMNAYNLLLGKPLINDSKILFEKISHGGCIQ